VTSEPEEEKLPLDLTVAFRITDWVDSLPEFWQPVANGALFIMLLMGVRVLALIPIVAAIIILHGHFTGRLSDLRALALLPIAIVAGGLSGLSYSIIGRRIAKVKWLGSFAAGFIAGFPYAVVVLFAYRWLQRQPLLVRFDGVEWFMVLCGCVAGGFVLGGPKFSTIAPEREVQRVGILIAAGIVLIMVVSIMLG